MSGPIRLAVISDSHHAKARVESFARLAAREGFDAVVHCGDGESDARWLSEKLPMPVRFVAGNCDFLADARREECFSLGGVRLFVAHGDRYGVKYGLERLSYRAEELGARAALFGHTHAPFAGYAGGVLLVNPGALKDGRYAVLRIAEDAIEPRLEKLESGNGEQRCNR